MAGPDIKNTDAPPYPIWGFDPPSPEPDTKKLDALLDSLNASAERFQTLWFSFLGLTLYLAIAARITSMREGRQDPEKCTGVVGFTEEDWRKLDAIKTTGVARSPSLGRVLSFLRGPAERHYFGGRRPARPQPLWLGLCRSR